MAELKPKIMIVDDEPFIGELLTRFLSKRGYEAISFTSGQKALTYLENNPVNLVLTDLVMPEMNGIELIKAVKALHPNLPILVMLGWVPEPELMDDLIKLGIPDHIAKPFTLKEIETTIASRLQLHNKQSFTIKSQGNNIFM